MSSLHSRREKKQCKVKVSSISDRRFGSSWSQDNRKKTSTNNECNSWRNIKKWGKHINQPNEWTRIKLHRGSRTLGRSNNSSLFIIDFPIWRSQIYLRSTKGGTFYTWPHTPGHRSEGQYRSGWNGYWLHYLYSFAPFSLLSHSPTMTCRHGQRPWCIWEQGNQYYRYLRCLVAPVSLDLSTWPPIRQCSLRLSRPSEVTLIGALA